VAYSRRDTCFDGQFVAAVRTTGIYCRPSCSCRRPRPEHAEYFPSADQADHAGYRACKRCRPELPGGVAEAERRFVERALDVMQARLDEPLSVGGLAAALAASASSFAHRFRAADGRTPMRALADLRVERAKILLATARGSVLDIAMSAGFQSLSAFARAFHRRTGLAPSVWRARYARGGRSPAFAVTQNTGSAGPSGERDAAWPRDGRFQLEPVRKPSPVEGVRADRGAPCAAAHPGRPEADTGAPRAPARTRASSQWPLSPLRGSEL